MKQIRAEIVVQNGKIQKISPSRTRSCVIDLDSKVTRDYGDSYFLLGLVDSHLHIWGMGMLLFDPNFTELNSAEKCVEVAAQFEPNRGDWLYGRGWNHEKWQSKEFPDKKLLDIVFPNNPVFFWRVDGHAAWVNSKALQLAKISRFTSDPNGGKILRDDCGNPNGILIDSAATALEAIIPPYKPQRLEKMILGAIDEFKKAGLTGAHDMDVPPDQIEIFKSLDAEGKLNFHVTSYISAQNDEYLTHNVEPYEGNYFKIKGIKFFADGALGSSGAALLSPYDDQLDTRGFLLMSEDTLYEKAKTGIERGFDIATHAIGDSAVRMVLNVYERLRKNNIPRDSTILRIEHAQTIHPDDLPRFAKLGVFAAVQPIHCTSDAAMAFKRLGTSRCRSSAYLWQSLLSSGAVIAGGSDSPIEPYDPFRGIKAFTRRQPDGFEIPFFPKEKINLVEALKCYTEYAHAIAGGSTTFNFKPGDKASFTIVKQGVDKTLDIKELQPQVFV